MLVEVPAIIDGKKTKVKLTEGRARWVKEKGEGIIKGKNISDAKAYQIAFNKEDTPQERLGYNLGLVPKDAKVQGALEYLIRKFNEKLTPEKQAERLDRHFENIDPNRAAPLWDTYFKLIHGAYGRDTSPNTQIQVNFNNFEKID